MRPFKSIFLLMLLSFAFNSFSAESFQFDPQLCTAHIDSNHVYFTENATNEKAGPELFIDESNADFFNLIKTMITSAVAEDKKINLMYENINSQNHGEYKRIIPDF